MGALLPVGVAAAAVLTTPGMSVRVVTADPQPASTALLATNSQADAPPAPVIPRAAPSA